MFKEIITQKYFCDLCGEEIDGAVFSPIWGRLLPDSDGNYERDGDIINVDICHNCVDKAEKMIFLLFQQNNEAETEVTEIDKNSEKIDAKPQKIDAKEKKGGRKSNLDDGKIMALHRAGWSAAKIAEEFGVSSWTIGQHIKKAEASGAFVDEFPDPGEMEGEDED